MMDVTVLGSGDGNDGISISASDTELTNVRAEFADENGIEITAKDSRGTVTLNNVTSQNNGQSGALVNGNETNIGITGGSFNNNDRFGIEALNSNATGIPLANNWTDAEDYFPGSTVTISGNNNSLNGETLGFIPGETVRVEVNGPNSYTSICEATAGDLGQWNCQVVLWDSELAIGDYSYTATGLTSDVVLNGSFTDARTISASSLNGGSSTTVAPGATISVSVSVTTDTSGSGIDSSPDWSCTDYRIGTTGPYTPVDHANFIGAGTNTVTFNITAPSTAGTYSITFRAYSNDGCNKGSSTAVTLSSSIIVSNDVDGDGIANTSDNCPNVSNPAQTDTDGDGTGDACDSTPYGPDTDSDGVPNSFDNCPAVANTSQTDTDGDGTGDACDSTPNGDTDGDGVDNNSDNCPAVANASQTDTDGDGTGDACDSTPNGTSSTSTGGAGDSSGDGANIGASLGFLIPVTGGQLRELSCDTTVTTLNSDRFDVLFADLCGYSALLDRVTSTGIPSPLPANNTYLGGVQVMLFQDGNLVNDIPDGTTVTLEFDIPDSSAGKSLAILFWDAGSNSWVKMDAQISDGKLTLPLTDLGTYVVVDETSVGQVDSQIAANDLFTITLNWLKNLFRSWGGS